MVAPVDGQRNVEFLLDVGQLLDQELLDRRALGTRLGRDDVRRQHLFGCRRCFFWAAHQLDAARLAPSAGVYLGLHDRLAAQLLGGGLSLRWRRCDYAARHGYPVAGEYLFGLELVDVH